MAEPLRLGEVGAHEQEDVTALWREGGLTRPWNDPATDFHRAHGGPASAVLGAYQGDRLVGTVMVGHEGHRGWIYYLAVASDRQRSGVGRALLLEAEDWLRGRGIPKLMLMIRSENDAVADFYRRRGYQRQEVQVWGRFLDE